MIDEHTHVTLSQLAELLGLTPRRVMGLSRDGRIPRAERGRYPLARGLQGYFRYLREGRRGAERVASENRVRDARADEIELRVAGREARLVDTDEAAGVCRELVALLRGEAARVPARVSHDPAVKRRIDEELDVVFGRTTARLEARAAELQKGGRSAEAADRGQGDGDG